MSDFLKSDCSRNYPRHIILAGGRRCVRFTRRHRYSLKGLGQPHHCYCTKGLS